MFRRRTSGTPAVLDSERPAEPVPQGGKPAGKGRPTPKRSEVERRRRQPYAAPPTDRKAASAQERERRRAESKRRMDAMRRGEEWAIPPRDRGPVRALARDYIDSRRVVISEYILFAIFVLILLIFLLGAAQSSLAVLYLEVGIVGIIGAESFYHAGRVAQLVKKRYPGESTRGLTWYIAKRAMRLRGSRIPPARVKRGDSI